MGPIRVLSLATACITLAACEDLFGVPPVEDVQPNAPSRFTMVDYTDGVLTLRWEDASSIEAGYGIVRAESIEGDDFVRFDSLAADSEEFQVGITKPARFRVAVLGGSRPWAYLSACLYYEDLDGDGSGTQLAVIEGACPNGTASFEGGDCDDSDPARFPGNKDICDGIDNDCDNLIDGGTVYLDADGDGHGTPAKTAMGCGAPVGYVTPSDDCDDGDRSITGPVPMYRDSDGDGFGSGTPEVRCPRSTGYSLLATDCDNEMASVSPSGTEMCDGQDNDCDGKSDEESTCVSISKATLPSGRERLSCTSIGERVYCLGGSDSSDRSIDEILEYDPITENIRSMTAKLPSARFNLSCVPTDKKIYCFGGDEKHWENTPLDHILEYDPSKDVVRPMAAVLPTVRSSQSCTPIGASVFCFGGAGLSSATNKFQVLDDIFKYEPSSDTITPITAKLPTYNTNLSCAAVLDQVFCMGGYGYGTTNEKSQVVQFIPSTDSVRTAASRLPSARSGLSCVPYGDRILCFGGITPFGILNQIVEYAPATDRISILAAMLPYGISHLSCTLAVGKILCFGGYRTASEGFLSDQIIAYTPPEMARGTTSTSRSPERGLDSGFGCEGEPIGSGR